MTEIKIGDEDVEIAAEAAFWAEDRRETEDWAALAGWEKDSYRHLVRQIMAKLVASGWRREEDVLRTEAPPLLRLLKAAIAYEIRAELVCCDIYEQLSKERDERRWRTEMTQGHHLCYWGEAAARIAESHELGSEAEQYVSAGTREQEDQERDEEQRPNLTNVPACMSTLDDNNGKRRVCIFPRGHGGAWHDDGSACWPAEVSGA